MKVPKGRMEANNANNVSVVDHLYSEETMITQAQ